MTKLFGHIRCWIHSLLTFHCKLTLGDDSGLWYIGCNECRRPFWIRKDKPQDACFWVELMLDTSEFHQTQEGEHKVTVFFMSKEGWGYYGTRRESD